MKGTHRRRSAATLPILPSLSLPPPLAQRESGKVMKSEWVDPDDTTPGAAKSAKTVRAWRKFDPLRRLVERHGTSITEQHVMAADQLRSLADGAAIGYSAPKDEMVPVTQIVYRPSQGPGSTARRQAQCWRQFVKAMGIFTQAQRALIVEIVLLNTPVAHAAAKLGKNAQTLMGVLEACLDLLVDFFSEEVYRIGSDIGFREQHEKPRWKSVRRNQKKARITPA
jgi:hypothetical protein